MYKQMGFMLHLSVCLGPVDNNTFYKLKAIPVNIKLLRVNFICQRSAYDDMCRSHGRRQTANWQKK